MSVTNPTNKLRDYLFYSTSCFFTILLIGSGLNNKGSKYSISTVNTNCSLQVYIRNIADSVICCDDGIEFGDHSSDWICVAASDQLTKLICSKLAFIIPFIPLLINTIIELLYLITNKSFNSIKHVIKSSFKRFLLCISLVLFRTYFLYSFLNETLIIPDNSNSCWYLDITKDRSCKDHFDFSDHIVLMYAQYLLPAIVEFTYVNIIIKDIYNHNSTFTISWIAISYAVTIIILFTILRIVFYTALFFHTPNESIFGFVLAFITSGTFIYILASSKYWIELFQRNEIYYENVELN